MPKVPGITPPPKRHGQPPSPDEWVKLRESIVQRKAHGISGPSEMDLELWLTIFEVAKKFENKYKDHEARLRYLEGGFTSGE